MTKLLYPIYKLPQRTYERNIPTWIKYWLYTKSFIENVMELSEILTGSEFTLLNTINKKFKIFELSGRTEQEQLEGYNLLEVTYVYEQTTLNGVTFKTNSDGTITLNGTATANMDLNFMKTTDILNLEANQNYMLSKKVISGSATRIMIAYYLAGATTIFTTDTKDLGSNTDIRTLQNCRIFVNSGDVFNNVTVGLMLLKASTDKNWEPYCRTEYQHQIFGYECPIKNVSGNTNEKIQNKNLFVAQKIVDDSNKADVYLTNDGYIRYKTGTNRLIIKPTLIKENTAYTFKLLIKRNNDLPNVINLAAFYSDGTSEVLYNNNLSNIDIEALFTTNVNKTLDYIRSGWTDNKEAFIKIDGSMILEGAYTAETIPKYVPHQEQNYPFTFSEGQFLADDEELQDNGMLKKWKKKIFDGTENFTKPRPEKNVFQLTLDVLSVKLTESFCNYYTQQLINSDIVNSIENNKFVVQTPEGFNNSIFYIRDDRFNSTQMFKEWLTTQFNNETPIELEIKLAESEYYTIPYNATQQEQYNSFKNAYTYKDITYISGSSDELAPELTIQYWKKKGGERSMKLSKDDLKKKLDERIEDEDLKIELLEDVEDSFDEVVEDTVERVEKTMYDELESKYDELKTKYKERFFKTEDETVTEEKEDETGLSEETVYEKEDIFEDTKKEED